MNLCPLCSRCRGPVLPTGPTPCRVLLVGEAPNWNEDEKHQPAVGKAGVELTQTYLRLAFLTRDDVYITNARYCSELDYSAPTVAQVKNCAYQHFGPTLEKVSPQVVVPMGKLACSIFPEITNLAVQHGIPLIGRWGSYEFVLFPTFNPQMGTGSTGYMIPLMSDFNRLGQLLRELETCRVS